MAYEFITYSVKGGVATLVLNRPDVLNSFNRKMATELQEALRDIKENQEVRSVLLTGAGRGFCAGQDLASIAKDYGSLEADLGQIVEGQYNPVVRAIRHTEIPFVCAVNGVAAGAGANLALHCDIVVASEKASFVQAFSRVGLIPDTGGTFILPRLVGTARATALMMLAEKVSAADAVSLGMIYKVFPEDSFLNEASKIAAALAKLPTLGLGYTKRLLNSSAANTLDAQLDLELRMQRAAGETVDYKEGVKAFIEKREPQFSGR